MKQKTGRKLLGVLLTLAMVVGLVPGMGLTAYAATSHGITINTAQHGTVTASVNGSAATSAEEGATVTLTANPDNGYRLKSISGTYKGNPQETKGLNGTKTINGTYFNLNATDAAGRGWKLANNSTITITSKDTSVKIVKVDFNITQRGNSFNLNNVSCSAGTKSLNGNTLSVSSINGTTVTLSSSANNAGYVRFNSVTIYGTGAVDTNLTISTTGDVNVRTFTMPTVVQGDVTITPVFEEIPKYNVTLNGGANAITSGGNTTQTGVTGAMTTVTYTANSGYHFTEFANITNNGITATRTSDTVVAVSGTPTADASITIPDAVADAVAVTGVTLNPSAAQTIDVDGKVSFTATVAPDNATDKKVKWNVGGTDTGAVKLYSDEACTTEVGADAIETLTVYAKGISAGSATVTATSNADSEKKASCDVTVNAAQTQTETLLTTITATGKEQASYSTENVATVSFSYTANGYSSYTNNGKVNWGWWGYGWSATVNAAEGYTITKCVFYDDKDRTATDSEAPFVVETTEEDKTPKVNGTPILANTSKGITKIEVYGYATPAPALDPVSYMAWNGTTLVEKTGDDACTDYTVVTADTTTFEDGKWYVMSNSVTVSSRITVTGTVNLILCDGATLTASKGITVNSGNTINIYAQIGGTGELNAGSDTSVASIGGGYRGASSGTVNIHGGKITATGGTNASGIGGALEGGNGEVNIYGGNVTARGKNYAAGIGGYSKKSGGTVNIYGGTVNASGSQYGTTGIGIGGTNPGNCVVHIYGGEVTATSEKAAAGIQGTITIDGGTVTANGGGDSNSIDCYSGETYSSNGISGTVTINGGTVSATGGNVTGEITNFGGNIYACNGIGGTVTINGGTVTATGGSHTGNFENHRGTTVKEKGFGGSLTLGTGMYLYGGTSANPESNLSNYRAGAGDYTGDRYVYMTVNNVVPHIHSFTYTADGATVTATCGAEGCDLTSNPTLTIVAPTLTTYGQTGEGISEKATLDGLDAFNSATDLTVAASDIKYYGVEEYEIEGHTYKKQGDELAQVPTAAGEYVAGLTLSNVKTSETETGDVIARVWYTIAPASISSVTVTDITAPVATEALDTEAATSTANVTLGAVTWNPTTTPAAYATQYTATVIATAAANYAFADTVTATVNGQAATVTKNDGGTLTIAYTFEKTALTPVTITATDKKADWSADGIAIPVEGMFTITEGAGAATYTVTNGTGEGTYDAQTGKLTVTKCGTFTVKVSTAATDTYAAGAETTATLTVNKVDSTAATVTANTLIYTGSAQALVTVTGEATGGTMQYALGTATEATQPYTTSIPTAADVGTYYVWYKVVGDANHNSTEPNSVEAKINPVNKTDLNTAIEEAAAYYESIKEDDVYAQVAEALKKAIDEAKKYTNDNVAEKEVKEAIDTIKAAKVDAEEGKKEADDTVVANEVADAINALPASDKVATTDKAAIEAARKAYDALTADQKEKVPADILKKLTDADTALTVAFKAAQKEAADKAAADKVIEAINTLPAKEDVTASDKEAVEAARAAYDALTASQKDKIDTATLQKLTDAEEALVALGELDKNVVAFNSEKNVQKAEAVKLAKEDDSDAVRKLIADAREAIDALAYDKNKSLDENKAVLAAIITELGNALEEQRELEKILAVVKIDQGETVAEVDKTAIKEEDVETVTNVAKSTDADLSEAATTCVKQIVEESETVEDSDKNIVIVPALDVKGKEYSVTETDATMTLDIEAVYTSYETTSDITTAADVKSATEAEDKTEKAKVKEIGSGKLDTEGTPVNVEIEVPAAFAGVLGATTETVKASPATIYVKHTHKNKNYEYNASLYCEGSKYFVEFVNPNGFSPFTLSGNSASVASIGDKNYTDLQSAIDDAADGSTIKLTNDNDVSATINTEKTITIDKDNHTGNVDIKAADTLLLTKTDNENGTTTYKTVTKYTVTFDNNGGKGTMPAQEIGGTAALNANAFTKEGYTFDGWNIKSDGSGTAYADKADVTPAADMTLYAQWKENPKPDDKDKTDAEVEAVKTKINALKAADKITTADKAAIEAADKAYDALSEARKKLIDVATLKKLTDAKAALKAAEKAESDKAAADAVKTRINALKAADKITTTDKAAVEEARKAYDALSADQKKLVDAATLKKLTDAEKAFTTAEANDKAARELAAAKQEAQAAMNEQITVTQKGNKFTVKWKKASSADGYYVYASYCGKKATKPVKTVKKNTTTKVTISKINGKKISTKKNFHVYVVPYKIIDGKKVALGKSTVAHLVGAKSTKYSNVKKLTLTKKKYTVKVGKTAKIKAKVTLVNNNKKHIPKSHGAKFRYKSSDTSIATVDKNGKVKGIRKGTCTIYVYSINGLMKKAKVTVK